MEFVLKNITSLLVSDYKTHSSIIISYIPWRLFSSEPVSIAGGLVKKNGYIKISIFATPKSNIASSIFIMDYLKLDHSLMHHPASFIRTKGIRSTITIRACALVGSPIDFVSAARFVTVHKI